MDRFLMHVYMDYPDDDSEREVIRLVRNETRTKQETSDGSTKSAEPISQSAIFGARSEIDEVQVSESMEAYIVALVAGTRRPADLDEGLSKYIQVGSSPRASIGLDKCSRAHAWMDGRKQVTPDDIRAVVNDCLRHRILLTYEANADGITTDDIIGKLVKLVAVA
jgi:MoxR-like ATPase